MDLFSVAPNSTPPRLVNNQLVSFPPVGILNLLCLICIIFVCYAHLNIFTWNLRDVNVYYYYYYYYLITVSIFYCTLFLLYSDADVHTLIACVRDALEQQNSGTAVNDRYLKLTFNIDGTSVESCPCTVNSLIATTFRK